MMNKTHLIYALLLFFSMNSAFSQESETPNILADHAIDQQYTLEGILRFQIPVPLGGGVAGSYYIPNLIHVQGEAGLGWTYVTKPAESEANLLTPWFNAFVGYPLHFKTVSNAKYTISRGSRGTVNSEEYFNIQAPYHNFIIPEVGFVANPTGYYMASAFALGVSYRRLLNADAKINSVGGKVYEGRMRKYTYFSGGLLIPLKDQIILDDGSIVTKSDIVKFYMKVGFYYFGATWEIGASSFGYANESLLLFGAKFAIR